MGCKDSTLARSQSRTRAGLILLPLLQAVPTEAARTARLHTLNYTRTACLQTLNDAHAHAQASSPYRICKLRQPGRRWLAAFEDSTQKRHRLIRTRSSGSLGLLGPPCVDASKTTTILPLTGHPPSATELPERYKVFFKLQVSVLRFKSQRVPSAAQM